MDRRQFISRSVGAGLLLRGDLLGARADAPAAARSIRVVVDRKKALAPIPANFLGLGYEISSVAETGLLSANNHSYVQLVRTLGAHGVIRVGGNTSDYSRFSRDGDSLSAPKATVVSDQNLRDLGSFLEATGWDLIWGLNLGRGTEQEAVEEAAAVVRHAKNRLLAFEIGNEPDLFRRIHRGQVYQYEDYLTEYRRFKGAIRRQVPNAAFAGPDVASATDWVARFAVDEGADLKLLTHHYYRECSNPTSTCDKLLQNDPKLAPELEKLRSSSASSHVPYRICETNSFCGGGKPGVSDTFCSALWALDFLFKLASADAAGVNIETGVNQLGFVSSYSPLGDDGKGTFAATPEYYGLLAFAQSSRGRRIAVDCGSENFNLTAYAVVDDQERLTLTLINKNESVPANARIGGLQFARATNMRLKAPSLGSKGDVSLGGSTVRPDGSWTPGPAEVVLIAAGDCQLNVPAASAVIATFEP